jgi:hypothetical protein
VLVRRDGYGHQASAVSQTKRQRGVVGWSSTRSGYRVLLGCHDPGWVARRAVVDRRSAPGLGEVREDAVDGVAVGDERQQPSGGAAVGAGQGVDEEDAAEEFGPEGAWSGLGLWFGGGLR